MNVKLTGNWRISVLASSLNSTPWYTVVTKLRKNIEINTKYLVHWNRIPINAKAYIEKTYKNQQEYELKGRHVALITNLTNFVQFWPMKFLTCFTVSKILLQQHKTMSWCILQNNTFFMKGYVLNFPLRLMITDGKTMRIALLHCMPQYRTSGSSMRLCKTVSRSSLEMEQSPSSENSTTSGKKRKYGGG